MSPRVRSRGVWYGALTSVIIAVPAALGAVALDSNTGLGLDSNWVFLFLVVVLGGFVVGGAVAGWLAPASPALHGALAALAAYAVVQVIAALVRLAEGDDQSLVSVVFNGILATTAGALGGMLGGRLIHSSTRAGS